MTQQTLPKSKFTMAGTEGTGQYVGVASTVRGTVAVREYCPGFFRIRVEPKSESATGMIARKLTRNAGWKQPGDSGENRFSTMVGTADLSSAMKKATDVLGVGRLKSTELDMVNALRHVARKAGAKVAVTESKANLLSKIVAIAT